MAGKREKIYIKIFDIGRHVRHRLRSIADDDRAIFMSDFCNLFDIDDKTEDIRHMSDGDNLCLLADDLAEIFRDEFAIFIKRNIVDFAPGHLADFKPR